MNIENIKAKVSFYFKGSNRPFVSVEDYETLKRLLYIKSNSDSETVINEIMIDDIPYKIEEIKISILKETATGHMEYGMQLALEGEPMPYNMRVSVFVQEQ